MNRRERAAYAKALASMKRWAREDRPENWTAEEWGNLVGRVSSQKAAVQESGRFLLLRPIISMAAALIVLVWAAVFLLKTPPADLSAQKAARPAKSSAFATGEFRPLPEIDATSPSGRAESGLSPSAASTDTHRLLATAAETRRSNENRPAFTWISPETGLKIVWFTNNNLKLEDLP